MGHLQTPTGGAVGGGGGGGGFSPTPWALEAGQINLQADPNDPGWVSYPTPTFVDPKKEYFQGVALFNAGDLAAPLGTVTVNAIGVTDGGFGTPPEATGQITCTNNGTILLGHLAGPNSSGLVVGRVVNSGIITGGGIPPLNGPFVFDALGFGGGVFIQLSDGELLKNWQMSGAGFDALFFAFARQVEP